MVKFYAMLLLILAGFHSSWANTAFESGIARSGQLKRQQLRYLFEYPGVEVIDRHFANTSRPLEQTSIAGHSQRLPGFDMNQYSSESRYLAKLYEDMGSAIMYGDAALRANGRARSLFSLVQRARFHFERLTYVGNTRLDEIIKVLKKMEANGVETIIERNKILNLDSLVKEADEIIALQKKMTEAQSRLVKLAKIDDGWAEFKKGVAANSGPHRFYQPNGRFVSDEWHPTSNAYTNDTHPEINSKDTNNILERARGAFGRESREFFESLLKSVKKVRP